MSFNHLHLNTLTRVGRHSQIDDHWIYRVEGKVRPMLVWKVEPKERGNHWFRVIPFTTKPNGIRIGPVLPSKGVSYALPSERLPENMMESFERSMDPLEFELVLRIVSRYLLASDP